MSTTYSKLFETLANLPDPVLAEVLDFAEFLQAKRLVASVSTSDEPLINLAGGLDNATSFAKDASAARATWN